jgi:hypothetical protein
MWKEVVMENFQVYSRGICLEGLRKTTRNINQNSQFLVSDTNLRRPKYVVGLLPTGPQRLVQRASTSLIGKQMPLRALPSLPASQSCRRSCRQITATVRFYTSSLLSQEHYTHAPVKGVHPILHGSYVPINVR